MQLVVLIPAFFIFLYKLYILVKDDHVFIRKNISSEQLFDIVFVLVWISLLSSHLVALFSFHKEYFSLVGGFLGGVLGLYLIGKYKKIPLTRLFDFFTLAFVFALPFGYLGEALFARHIFLFLTIVYAGVYFIFNIFFFKFFHSLLMSRELKEGILTTFFFIFFSFMSFLQIPFQQEKGKILLFNIENILLLLLLVVGLVLFLRQANNGLMNKKR